MSQQYIFTGEKAKNIQVVRASVNSRSREVILPQSSVLMRPHPESQDHPDNQTSALKALYHRYREELSFDYTSRDHLFQPHCSIQGHLKQLSQPINSVAISNLLLRYLIERLYEGEVNYINSLKLAWHIHAYTAFKQLKLTGIIFFFSI